MDLKILDKMFGQTTDNQHDKIYLPLLFCIFLTSSTFFFYDHKSLHLLGYQIHMSVGLVFFPFTFTIVNIIQDRYGKLFANTAVRYGFLCDALFVGLGYFLASLGERADYYAVYSQLPSIMGMTFIFVWISNLLNTLLFEKIKKITKHIFLRYFVSSFTAETIISGISIPLMMRVNNLNKGAVASILFIVLYKIFISFILSGLVSMKTRTNTHHP
ncbi:VUT family protein [Cedecea sp. NFIX57]|uniref:VUT family protein n=1 Tax=Cedecea sp. NFIX57 TaxID=1566286 RepID=UPI000A099136|nr:Putative vitamin uptake transporter [Cedecea sp. NFIX57]